MFLTLRFSWQDEISCRSIGAIDTFLKKHAGQSWVVEFFRSHHDHKELTKLEEGLDKGIHMFLVCWVNDNVKRATDSPVLLDSI